MPRQQYRRPAPRPNARMMRVLAWPLSCTLLTGVLSPATAHERPVNPEALVAAITPDDTTRPEHTADSWLVPAEARAPGPALASVPPDTPDTQSAAAASTLSLRSARPSPWQRLSGSLQGLWSRVQGHLPWGPEDSPMAAADAPRGTRDALLAELGSRRTPRSAPLMLYSQEAADGGVRANAGVVRSESGNWWLTHQDRYGGLHASYNRLNASGVLSSTSCLIMADTMPTRAYLGASFSSLLTPQRSSNNWRLSADLGVMSMANLARLSPQPGSERSLDDALRDMRLRPNVKLSVGYSF